MEGGVPTGAIDAARAGGGGSECWGAGCVGDGWKVGEMGGNGPGRGGLGVWRGLWGVIG